MSLHSFFYSFFIIIHYIYSEVDRREKLFTPLGLGSGGVGVGNGGGGAGAGAGGEKIEWYKVKSMVKASLLQFYGLLFSSVDLDFLMFGESSLRFILRTPVRSGLLISFSFLV